MDERPKPGVVVGTRRHRLNPPSIKQNSEQEKQKLQIKACMRSFIGKARTPASMMEARLKKRKPPPQLLMYYS